MTIKMIPNIGNWEMIAFILFQDCIVGSNPHFSRSELMTDKHLDTAVDLTKLLGHKKNPTHPDKTLQRTIQNMRDKGLMEFLGRGEYRLTESGFEIMQIVAEKFPYQQIRDDL